MPLALLLLCSGSVAGDSLPERLAARATQPDVVLVPPVGEPSPRAGSFVVPYQAGEGEAADPDRVGTFDVAPSSCSDALVFKAVPADEKREELWLVSSGIGARIGLPKFGLQVGNTSKSMAGIAYQTDEKLIVDGGLDALEMCCLRTPEKCTDRYVSEFWRGTGSLYRLTSSGTAIKSSLKALDKVGRIEFGRTKGWTSASTWETPMYFAYRTQGFQPPSCASYMNDLPAVKGQELFTGVSQRSPSEQEARRDARADARQQVVRFLGETFQIEGDEVTSSAEALLSGVKDALTCLDPVLETPEGPHYLARVRMYLNKERLREAASEMTAKK